MTAAIVGWAHTPFGKLDAISVESLIVRVTREALDHAGLQPSDVDEIVLGHFGSGFSPQDFTASLVLQASNDLRFKPATRVENACATGSAAVHQAPHLDRKSAKRCFVPHIWLKRVIRPTVSQGFLAISLPPTSSATVTRAMLWQ